MSDATAELFTPEGELVGFTVYQGSADMIAPDFWPTEDEAWKYRRVVSPRGNGWDRLAACEHKPREALCVSHYGAVGHWPVQVCPECAVTHGRLSPYPLDYGYSGPTPAEAQADREWLAAGWPHRGHPFRDEL